MVWYLLIAAISLSGCRASRNLIKAGEKSSEAPITAEGDSPSYTATYSASGIPGSFYQSPDVTIEFGHEGLKAIEYSVGAECTNPKVHDVNMPLTIPLENFHTKINLCLRGIDQNELIEPGEGTKASWTQGYPDLIGRAIKSTCEVISPVESFLVSIKLSQEIPGEAITPSVSNEIFSTGDCTGPIALALTLLSENLSIATDSLSMTIEGEPWRLEMTTNEAGGIQFFTQSQGPFGTDGRTFIFTDPL